MKLVSNLERLSEELREMPRHLWDEHLWEFCERLLMQRSGLQPARIPMKVESDTAELANRARQRR
jgi:hypothetical protein